MASQDVEISIGVQHGNSAADGDGRNQAVIRRTDALTTDSTLLKQVDRVVYIASRNLRDVLAAGE